MVSLTQITSVGYTVVTADMVTYKTQLLHGKSRRSYWRKRVCEGDMVIRNVKLAVLRNTTSGCKPSTIQLIEKYTLCRLAENGCFTLLTYFRY